MKRARQPHFIVTLYLLAVASLLLLDLLWSPAAAPVEETASPAIFMREAVGTRVSDALVFISDTDSIDAGRQSNSVYRVGLDGRGLKRIVGSIPHGDGYLRTTDIACAAASQALVIASHRRDLNGFHHAMLDGTGLHLDQPAAGDLLSATRQIAVAPAGADILVSRRDLAFAEARFALVAGDLLSREFKTIKHPRAEQSYVSPVWSPDNSRFAYIIERHQPDMRPMYALASAAPDGSDEGLIHETALTLNDIDWSPKGDWLALEMNRQIYKLRPDGSGLTRLSSHPAGAASPRWSPDGARISYVAPSSFPGFNQLMTMNADGSEPRQVINIHGALVNGCWI